MALPQRAEYVSLPLRRVRTRPLLIPLPKWKCRWNSGSILFIAAVRMQKEAADRLLLWSFMVLVSSLHSGKRWNPPPLQLLRRRP